LKKESFSEAALKNLSEIQGGHLSLSLFSNSTLFSHGLSLSAIAQDSSTILGLVLSRVYPSAGRRKHPTYASS